MSSDAFSSRSAERDPPVTFRDLHGDGARGGTGVPAGTSCTLRPWQVADERRVPSVRREDPLSCPNYPSRAAYRRRLRRQPRHRSERGGRARPPRCRRRGDLPRVHAGRSRPRPTPRVPLPAGAGSRGDLRRIEATGRAASRSKRTWPTPARRPACSQQPSPARSGLAADQQRQRLAQGHLLPRPQRPAGPPPRTADRRHGLAAAAGRRSAEH